MSQFLGLFSRVLPFWFMWEWKSQDAHGAVGTTSWGQMGDGREQMDVGVLLLP